MKRTVTLLVLVLILGFALQSSGALSTTLPDFSSLISRVTSTIRPGSDTTIHIEDEPVRLIDEEAAVIQVIEDVSPSVVTVGVERERTLLQYDPFDPFSVFEQPRSRGTETEEADIGSGFIISESGLIVTNKHVVSDSDYQYRVITSDNQTYEVQNIYRDPSSDLAILKIEAPDLRPVTLGNSDNLKVGQTVIALGTPLGEFRGTVTKGIVSGLGRGITAGSPFQGMAEELSNVIQTDAAINPGNSGGPLVNTSGQVIGINTAVASGAENIGFALPINIVKEAVENFEKTGSFDRAFLGVSYYMIPRETALLNDVPEGALVQEVVEGSAADEAGIAQGDIITSFDGTRIRDAEGATLAELINQKRQGESASVILWRDGEEKTLTVSLGEFDGR